MRRALPGAETMASSGRALATARSAPVVPVVGLLGAVVAGWWIIRAPIETAAVVAALTLFVFVLLSPSGATVLLAFLLPISPEVPLFALSTGLLASQTAFSDVEAGASLADVLVAVALGAILLKALVSRSFARRLSSPLTAPITVLWLVIALSVVAQIGALPRSALQISALYVARGIEVYAVYFLALATIRDARAWRRVFGAFLLSGLFAIVLGFHDTLTVEYDEDLKLVSGFRLLQFYRGELGNYMLLLTGLLLWLAAVSKTRTRRMGLRIATMLAAAGVFFSGKRAIVVGAIVMLGATVWLVKRRYRAQVVIGLGVALLAALVVLPDEAERIVGTFKGTGDISNLADQAVQVGVPADVAAGIDDLPLDSSTRHRLLRWATALTAAAASPLIGWGYYSGPWQGFGFAHNQYLGALAEMGIVGFVALLWFLRRLLRVLGGYVTRFEGAAQHALALTLYPLTISLVVQALFGDPFYYFKFMSIYWLAVGLLVTAGRIFPKPSTLAR